MPLTDLYESVGSCIVGFFSRIVKVPSDQAPPRFPEIIGTGFMVTSDGVAATNRHVIQALMDLPLIPDTNERSGAALIFMVSADGTGGQFVNLTIRRVAALNEFDSGSDWYGQDLPDVGFVQFEITGMPYLELATEDFTIRPGMEIATMGYPLGTTPLILQSRVNQMGPFIRRGIVSSVYPFSNAQPHGFTIDIMQQGGSSGSPIFAGDSPRVIGMMWGNVQEPRQTQVGAVRIPYSLNTNISIAEPAVIIRRALDKLLASREPLDPRVPSLQKLLEQTPKQEETTGLNWPMYRMDSA